MKSTMTFIFAGKEFYTSLSCRQADEWNDNDCDGATFCHFSLHLAMCQYSDFASYLLW